MNSSDQAPSHKVGSSMCTFADDKKCTGDEKRGINTQISTGHKTGRKGQLC